VCGWTQQLLCTVRFKLWFCVRLNTAAVVHGGFQTVVLREAEHGSCCARCVLNWFCVRLKTAAVVHGAF